MTEDEMNLDLLVGELEQENRLLRARNDRLMAEAEATNFDRTAAWLKACGKEQLNPAHLSTQIGCHLEEFWEFLDCIKLDSEDDEQLLQSIIDDMGRLSNAIKRGLIQARISESMRVHALDALCDSEVTGNGVAYLAGFDKQGADMAVLASNDAKLVDGKPVILPGGKIGKPDGWKAPDLSGFV